MAIENAYQSNLNGKIALKNITLSIKKGLLQSTPYDCGNKVQMITGVFDEVPVFKAPIISDNKEVVYFDGRHLSSLDRMGNVSIKNQIDFDFFCTFSKLEYIWSTDARYELEPACSFANEVFVRWLSGIVCTRFGLDPYQNSKVTAFCFFYSLGLYRNSAMEEAVMQRHIINAARTYFIDSGTLFEVFDLMGQRIPRDIDEFCTMLVEADFSPRLRDVNVLLMYNLIGAAWFGAYAKDHVALALEYPPAFTSLVYTACKTPVMKKSGIGQVVDRLNKGTRTKDFVRLIDRLEP